MKPRHLIIKSYGVRRGHLTIYTLESVTDPHLHGCGEFVLTYAILIYYYNIVLTGYV